MCVDAATGKIEWSKDAEGRSGDQRHHAKNSLASSTPAADGERVYAVFWDGTNDQPDRLGLRRQAALDQGPGQVTSASTGPGLSPMVVGDKVILNVDQDDLAEVIAFDAKTGDQVWKKSRPAFRACYTTPFVLEPRRQAGSRSSAARPASPPTTRRTGRSSGTGRGSGSRTRSPEGQGEGAGPAGRCGTSAGRSTTTG